MPVVLGDTIIRAALHQDLMKAWSTSKIYDGVALVPNNITDLPLAFIELQTIEVDRGGGTAGMGEVSMWHTYKVTGMFKWPDPRTITIEADKINKTQDLISLLTARKRYSASDFHRDLKSIEIENAEIEQSKEHIYTITVTFAVEVVSAA